jgi:hypothetical protein
MPIRNLPATARTPRPGPATSHHPLGSQRTPIGYRSPFLPKLHKDHTANSEHPPRPHRFPIAHLRTVHPHPIKRTTPTENKLPPKITAQQLKTPATHERRHRTQKQTDFLEKSNYQHPAQTVHAATRIGTNPKENAETVKRCTGSEINHIHSGNPEHTFSQINIRTERTGQPLEGTLYQNQRQPLLKNIHQSVSQRSQGGRGKDSRRIVQYYLQIVRITTSSTAISRITAIDLNPNRQPQRILLQINQVVPAIPQTHLQITRQHPQPFQITIQKSTRHPR